MFLDLIGKAIGVLILYVPDLKSKYLVATLFYFGVSAINHGLFGNENKSLFKLIPTFLIGFIINLALLSFFMAPVFSNFWGVVRLAVILNILGFVNIAMLCENPEDLLTRYFPIKVKVLRSLNSEDTRLFEFLTCWFTYIGCYLSIQYLDSYSTKFPYPNEKGAYWGSLLGSLSCMMITLFIGG